MNLNRKVLVAVAVILGALTGCASTQTKAVEEQAPVEPTATEPQTEAPAAVPQTTTGGSVAISAPAPIQQEVVEYAPFAPPALRIEVPGPAPRADGFYVAGYWRWNRTAYVWVPGRWETRRDGCDYHA